MSHGSDHPAVEVRDLTVRYGSLTAVDGISFRANAGQVTAVLGPNGAGKTTTIETCEGFRRATSGSVAVLGLDPAVHQRELNRRVGVMLQRGGVYPSARVLDTVRQYAALYGRGADAHSLVAAVGLADRATSIWRRLSGGEQQRLSLALALAAVPDVAFLDEPTAGVDINGRDAIRSIIDGLRQRGCAVVLATHDLDEAERLADWVIIVEGGRVVAEGTLNELRRGFDEIRFRSAPDLDVARLAQALGMVASKVGADEYVIDAPPHPKLMAQLTGWLAQEGLPLDNLRAGAQRLEDVFRRLTGRDEPTSGGDRHDPGTQS